MAMAGKISFFPQSGQVSEKFRSAKEACRVPAGHCYSDIGDDTCCPFGRLLNASDLEAGIGDGRGQRFIRHVGPYFQGGGFAGKINGDGRNARYGF